MLTNASIDYSSLLTSDKEREGIRLLQGDGLVTVKWTDIDTLTVLRTDDSVRPARTELENCLEKRQEGARRVAQTGADEVARQDRLGGLLNRSRQGSYDHPRSIGFCAAEPVRIMTSDAFAREWVEAWNRRDLESLLACYSDDVEFRSPLAAKLLGDPSWARSSARRTCASTSRRRWPPFRETLGSSSSVSTRVWTASSCSFKPGGDEARKSWR